MKETTYIIWSLLITKVSIITIPKKKQLRAGDNIFVGNVEELSPNVFTDDENIYYFMLMKYRKNLNIAVDMF